MNMKKGEKDNNPLNKFKKANKSLGFNLGYALIIFLILGVIYSYISDSGKDVTDKEISLSNLASEISEGKVAEIDIKGETLSIKLTDGSEKVSKKEESTALSQTLVNYGVKSEALAKVKINVENNTGAMYWFLNIAPFLFPLIFIIVFFWMISRQVKGTGVQALGFGQSRARMISPDDTKQRVTFKDVAGAKEAKEELSEIVDFLKNPKKFFDIGARIPKGILLMGAPGTGKCITGDTLLVTNKGLVRIDEVPKYFNVNDDLTVDGLEIVSLNDKNLEFNKARASHWYDLGIQDTYELKTGNGLNLSGTPEHPIVVVDEKTGDFAFKKLEDISTGEWVALGYNTQVFGNYTKIPDPEMAYFIGVLTGDGGMTIKDRVYFSNVDNELISKMQEISRKYFKKEFTRSKSQTCDYHISNIAVKNQLIEWGMRETYARNKVFPEWVNSAPKEYVTSFIKGLFDTDGTVEKKGSVSISSSSKTLINELSAHLLNLGIVTKVYDRKKKYNGQIQYYLNIFGDFVEQFNKEIGFTVINKQKRLDAVVAKQRNTNVNLIPNQGVLIKTLWEKAKNGTDEVLNRNFYSKTFYKNIKRYINGDRTPSREGAISLIEGFESLLPAISRSREIQFLKRISSGQFFFTKIESIKRGRERVYDLTVPSTHNFIANGLINHNTLLARAVAGEAGVSFFSISGSEFVEMFVGVGASRVRDLFKMAKNVAPAIIFIDEIDAVGRVRGVGLGGGNDEREQTLNQILVEMDGFEPTEKIIMMAATNRPDVLDPALLRPGRFDRRVTIDLPDRADRKAILEVHSTKKPFAEDVNLDVIATRTPGFSGADLYSLMNEGAILAAREGRSTVGQFDLIRAIEKVMLGPERKSHLLGRKEKEITAYHEAGHALVASVLPYADPVHKISVISRGRAAGYTLHIPLEDRKLQSRREFMDDIAVSLGGYVVEKKVFGDITTGPSNDLQVATALARDMVTKYGMSEKFGAIALEGNGGRAMFGKGVEDKDYSEKFSAEIDSEVAIIMGEARKKAEEIVNNNKVALDAIAKRLMEIETIEREEFEQIMIAHGIQPKKKQDIEHQV